MKIKCPVCEDEERHQYDNESYKEHDEEYHKLIEKIHEKIEYWQNEQNKASYNVYINEIEILKSLLEGKE